MSYDDDCFHYYKTRNMVVTFLTALRLSFVKLIPLTKEIRLKTSDPIISNSFPVRYYGISGTNLPDIPYYTPKSRLTYGIPHIL